MIEALLAFLVIFSMLSRLRTTKERRHTNTDSIRFRIGHTLAGSTDIPKVVSNWGRPTHIGDEWKITKLYMDFGIFDDPVDENVSFTVFVGDPDAPPDMDNTESASNILWTNTQFYRVLSSVGVIETTDTALVDLDDEIAWEQDGSQAGDILMGFHGSAAAGMFAVGFIEIEKSLMQSQVKDDFSEYEMDFLFEEALDEEEGEQHDIDT